jgi:hypothetical protein
MQPTSSSAPAASTPLRGNGNTGHMGSSSHRRNAYATTLRTNVERLIPLEMMHVRRSEVAHRFTTLERHTASGFADACNNTSSMSSAASKSERSTHTALSVSTAKTRHQSKSAPADIDLLCAVASRDLIAQTVLDLRAPGVWNEHLLDVLLALKRKQPDLLGAASLRVVASHLIPHHMALFAHTQSANKAQDPVEIATCRGPAPGPATATASGLRLAMASGLANIAPANPGTSVAENNADGHLAFVHDAQHYHIVNTKEAFFRAIISVREGIDPIAVSKQNIDALIEDTADFLEDHWREYYRVVWTRMAKSGAT